MADGLFANHMARLNVTYGGQNADLVDLIDKDLDDAAVKALATEAVAAGLPGIDPVNADFADFVVDRFPAKDDLPARVVLRPKTPFGG